LGKSRTVLIIDDEVAIGRAVEFMLQHAGHKVFRAVDGETGLALFFEHAPDVVITDLHVDKVNGREFCDRTVQAKRQRPFLTIVCSGSTASSARSWVADHPDTVFVEKPFSVKNLVAQVEAYDPNPESGGSEERTDA
jgi:DNA-binding response OmpR family regulator